MTTHRAPLSTSLLVLFLCTTACDSPAKDADSSSAPTLEQPPWLWRINGPNGPSYLFGTLHIIGADDIPPQAWSALDAAAVFVTETDLRQLDQQAINAAAQLPEGDDLLLHLTDNQWDLLLAHLPSTINPEDLRCKKPWYVYTLLTVLDHPAKIDKAMDQALSERAVSRDKQLIYLETIDQQFETLARVIDDKALARAIDNLDANASEVHSIIDLYRRADLSALETKISSDTPLTVKATLLDERNAAWTDRLDHLLPQGGLFIAVGAAHLLGEKGLLHKLQRRGYDITQVTGH